MGHVVAELAGVELVVARGLVLRVELARLLPRLVYHIVVDVGVIGCNKASLPGVQVTMQRCQI